MVLPGKRVIRGESLQPILSCARNCATPARLSSAQHNSEYLIDLIVRSSTLDFSRRLGRSWRNYGPAREDRPNVAPQIGPPPRRDIRKQGQFADRSRLAPHEGRGNKHTPTEGR